MKKKSSIKKLSKYLKQYKWSYILCTILILISTSSIIIYGGLIGKSTDYIIAKDINSAIRVLLLYFATILIIGGISRLSEYITRKNEAIISTEIAYDTYEKAMELNAYAYENMSSGEVINRITADTQNISTNINGIIDTLIYLILSGILTIYIFCNSYIIGIEIISFIIIFAIISNIFKKYLKKVKQEGKKEYDKLASLVNESVRGYREITVLGIINNLKRNMRQMINKTLEKLQEQNNINLLYKMSTKLLRSILEVSVFITCAILVCNGKMKVSFFISMTYYIYNYTSIIDEFSELIRKYQELEVSISRINEILFSEKYESVKYGSLNPRKLNGLIEFKNVTFGYKNEPIIFNNFNIKFEPNKKIAIVGSSGEGKSTIFNLLTRLFDPISGSITIDGIDLKDLSQESLRKNISIIRQEPFLFSRSIIDNFKIVKPNVTLKEIRKYCMISKIDDYIMSLEHKYDTILGEGGVNLSGGQKQRLAIARTLLKETKVILFDEATSALDNTSQKYIKESIDKLVSTHTVIIVAHRLSTIIDADIIYVIKNGKLLKSGTHEYLIKNCAYYKNLYKDEDKVIR